MEDDKLKMLEEMSDEELSDIVETGFLYDDEVFKKAKELLYGKESSDDADDYDDYDGDEDDDEYDDRYSGSRKTGAIIALLIIAAMILAYIIGFFR